MIEKDLDRANHGIKKQQSQKYQRQSNSCLLISKKKQYLVMDMIEKGAW